MCDSLARWKLRLSKMELPGDMIALNQFLARFLAVVDGIHPLALLLGLRAVVEEELILVDDPS